MEPIPVNVTVRAYARPPPFQHRFEGDSGVDVGAQEIDALFPDGERRSITLQVGAPFTKGGHTMIRTELENLDRTDGPLAGEGTLRALSIGIRWITCRLRIFEQKHGCKYYWPDANDLYDYEDIFSTSPNLKK